MDGRVDGCIQVGALAPGPYTIVLDQVVPERVGTTPTTHPVSAPGPIGAGVHLVLSPSSGAPGTIVTVTGTLRAPATSPPGYVDLCWDGCTDGLRYSGTPASWVSPTTFRTELVVPDAPWLEGDAARVVPPLPGQPAGGGRGFGGAALLPDGSLVVVGATWELLRAGSQAWCPVPGAPSTESLIGPAVVIGSRLWWLTAGASVTAQSRDLADLSC